MHKYQYVLVAIILSAYLAASCPGIAAAGYQQSKVIISTQEDLAQDVASAPCKEKERLEAVRALFLKMGAQPGQIVIEKTGGVENLVVTRPGQSEDTLVIGAHYDKTDAGCGVVDNWSGVIAIAHIFRSLKDISLSKTLVFVAFDKEEDGLLGSKAMVRGIEKEKLNRHCAMVNIDSLGLAAPQTLENLSSKPLINRAEEIAKRMNIPFTRATILSAGADSQPFIEKKIPAITISGLSNKWVEVIHTGEDKAANLNNVSLYLGYRLALALVVELHNLPCDVGRAKEVTSDK
ncbi:MAG TPA: M20/M25/M40 family metallo-hydrolase [Blastocatellia bacterium]|nr:M20/M25/M40 family metallo-hydrolase [Blastocatellia bacterium]